MPSGQSWAKAGSASSAETGAGSRDLGPKRRGAACCWTAPGHGCQTARMRGCLRGCRTCYCRNAAKSVEAAWRRSCRWRTGRPARPRPRCPAEAERVCSPAPSPCRGRGRRLRRLQGPRPAPPLRRLLPCQPTCQQPRPGSSHAMLESGCSKTATPPCVATALKSSLLLL